MEPPASKKAKITDHFRVALKPRDVNVQSTLKLINQNNKLQQQQQQPGVISCLLKGKDEEKNKHIIEGKNKKENIELITISDDEDENYNHIEVKPIDTVTTDHIDTTLNSTSTTTTEDNDEDLIGVVEPNKQQAPTRFESLHGNRYTSPPGRHPDVIDHDKTFLDNIICEPFYAWDCFKYDREQELKYITRNYSDSQQEISPSIRARLVDWVVEIQNYFELYHESIYMAVKMADQYLMRKFVPKENIQLLYLTTILISAKYDERLPPITISELISTAKQKFGVKYTRKQLSTFEIDILTTLEFNIRYPLSYGFLRRFAQCTRSDRKTLNLARYILETSLKNYEMIEELESKMAAGSLLLAFEMLDSDGAWDEAARFYTGYRQEELYPLVISLNDFIQSTAKRDSAITRKYSHELFMKVARIPPLIGLFASS